MSQRASLVAFIAALIIQVLFLLLCPLVNPSRWRPERPWCSRYNPSILTVF